MKHSTNWSGFFKVISFFKRSSLFFVSCLLLHNTGIAQITESFEGTINAVGTPVTHLPPGWSYIRLNGTNGLPNCADTVSMTTVGAFPNPGSTFNGSKCLRYNTRNAAFPINTINNTQGNDRVLIVTYPLDWSGRDTATGANLNRAITLRFYRDPSNNSGVDNINDNFEVYVNNQPDTIGGVRLTEVSTGANIIPRSAYMAPTFIGGGWQLLTYQMPAQVPGPGGSKFDTTSTGYVIFKFTSNPIGIGGNNMLVDSIYVPEWKTNMTVTHALMIYQNTATTSPGATNNVIVGVKVVTKGSLNPVKLDRMVFYPNGSSNFTNDVAASKLYYSHDTSYWYANAAQLPHIFGTNTIQPMDFGYWTNPCTIGTPAAFTLKSGTENYFWLGYDINSSPPATLGDYVDADFGFLTAGTNCTSLIGSVPSTLPGGLLIDVSYPMPTYTIGTMFLNYSLNDFTSAVELIGDNGTGIDNWYHDLTVGAPCSNYCNRFSAHPPDYTQFPATNAGLNKNRFVQITRGKGKRTSTPAYTLKAAAGTWFGSNNIRIFIHRGKLNLFGRIFNIINRRTILFHSGKLNLFRWILDIFNCISIFFDSSKLNLFRWILDMTNCMSILFYSGKLNLFGWIFDIFNCISIFIHSGKLNLFRWDNTLYNDILNITPLSTHSGKLNLFGWILDIFN